MIKTRSNILYWLLPLILFIFQLVFTFHSTTQIRFEEIAESARNVFWLQNRAIYMGNATNVGWYAILLVLYNIFGYSLFFAKYYRLALGLISLFCLAAFLKKYLGKYAWLPLLVIGLSPTLIFFMTSQTSVGIDLQYLPIALFLIAYIDFKKRYLSLGLSCFIFFFMMFAWMSYPTFVFYIPSLVIFYSYRYYRSLENQKIWEKIKLLLRNLAIGFIFFILPLVLTFAYTKDRNILFNDPATHTGIFRSGGFFNFHWENFYHNVFGIYKDLFIQPQSYYFDTKVAEFSNIYPLIIILIIAIFSIVLMISNKKFRFPFFLIWLILLFNIFISGFVFDLSGAPGIRRFTPVLVFIYGILTIFWYYFASSKFKLSYKILAGSLIMVVLIHSIITYSANYRNLAKYSPYHFDFVSDINQENNPVDPKEKLGELLKIFQIRDLELVCQDNGKLKSCPYSETYAAVLGSCLWNGLKCQNVIYGYDDKAQKFFPISIDLWRNRIIEKN